MLTSSDLPFRRQFRPLFLKLFTNSLFFVSTDMTGFAHRQERRGLPICSRRVECLHLGDDFTTGCDVHTGDLANFVDIETGTGTVILIPVTNPIVSTFATVRHRTVRSRDCLSNKTALPMIFKLAQAAENTWHRLRGHDQLSKIILGVKFNDGIEVVGSQAQAACRLTSLVTKIRR